MSNFRDESLKGLDELSASYNDDYNPGSDVMLSILDGSVQSQGLKVGHRDWLDMGSANWNVVPDRIKALSYIAATKIGGWTDEALKTMMLKTYPHLKNFTMDFTIQTLQELVQKENITIEDVNVKKAEVKISRHKKEK